KTYRDTRIALKTYNTRRGIDTLQEEWDKSDAKVQEQQKKVNDKREELNISDPDPTGSSTQPMPTLEPESLRKMEGERISAEARFKELETLYEKLSSLPREEFKKAVRTAIPDQDLTSLMEKMAESEIKLANNIVDYGDKHPEVLRVRDIIKTLE